MDRADATGFGVAAAGHAALLAALALGLAGTRLPVPKSDPIEVSFVEEVGLESTAPMPSFEAPAPAAPAQAPADVAAEPGPAPPIPALRAPAPVAMPAPKPVARPTPPKPAAATPRPVRSKPVRAPLSLPVGLRDPASDGRADTPPAAAAGPAVEASLVAEVRRQLKPHWQRAVPTGADAEALRTELSLILARDGRVTGVEVVRTTGITASNRPQVALHQERARRAVTLASPFNLPDQYYDAWKQLNVTLDLRLSQ